MSPWEESNWFEPIVQRNVVIAAHSTGQLCQANPRRVALLFFGNVSGGMVIAPDPAIPVNQTQGLQLTGTIAYLPITQKDWGPLCQAEWWGSSAAAQTQTYVIELILRDWPAVTEPNYEELANRLRSYLWNGGPPPAQPVIPPGGINSYSVPGGASNPQQ